MKPTNQLVNPMLTDFYQITMAYAYWKAGVHEEEAVFDLFFGVGKGVRSTLLIA